MCGLIGELLKRGKVGRISICHREVCLLLSLTVSLWQHWKVNWFQRSDPPQGSVLSPHWRGGNTWHCSGVIPAAS